MSLRVQRKKAFEKKMRQYRKFLKDDADYDWHFIVRLLRYKLERTRDDIVRRNIIVGANRVGNEIQAVVDLLLKIEANKYFEELHKSFWKKYGKSKLIIGQRASGNTVPVKVRYTKEALQKRKQIIKESQRLALLEEKLRRQDLEKAFKLMTKNMWNWWD